MEQSTNVSIENLETGYLNLDDRFNKYQDIYDHKIPEEHCFCIRLDGHGFSKFTKGFEKPYDKFFSMAMVYSTADAIKEFSARAGYTQSDEITLLFDAPDTNKNQTHLYAGRLQKLVSLTASFISIKFNIYLNKFVNEFVTTENNQTIYKTETINKINKCCAYFDARILSFPKSYNYELVNHLIWRSNDCCRNCIQTYAHYMFGPKKILGLNCGQMLELLAEKNIMWSDIPDWQKYGVFVKKELVTIITEEYGPVARARITAFSFKLFFDKSILQFFLAYYYHKMENVSDVKYPYFDKYQF